MGFLNELKDKASELGGKAKHGFDSAKDKAAHLVDDVKGRVDGDDHPDRAHDGDPRGKSDTKIGDHGAPADVVNDTPATASESVADTDGLGLDPSTTAAAVDDESDISSTMGDDDGLAEDFAANEPSSDLSSDAEPEAVDLSSDAPSSENSDSEISSDGLQETSEPTIDASQADAGTLDGDPDSASSWS